MLFRIIALIFSLEKPCYLENHVVREPCKRRSACICIFFPFFRSPRIYWNESSYALCFGSAYSRSCYIHYIKYCCCTSVRKKNINKNQSFENLKTKHFFYSLLKICFTCEKKTSHEIIWYLILICMAKWYNPKLGQSFSMIDN